MVKGLVYLIVIIPGQYLWQYNSIGPGALPYSLISSHEAGSHNWIGEKSARFHESCVVIERETTLVLYRRTDRRQSRMSDTCTYLYVNAFICDGRRSTQIIGPSPETLTLKPVLELYPIL